MSKVSDFTPDKGNANKGTQRGLQALDKSLRDYGAGRSILIDKKGRVIAGNKTLERAADIGIEDAIVVETDGTKLVAVKRTDLDLEDDGGKARALATYDNRVGQIDLDWDVDALKEVDTDVLKDLWTVDELDKLGVMEKPQDDAEPQFDRAAELQEKWQVKTGDLWKIGEHRLLCGDSTKREDVERVMGGETYNVLTDPPYNIGFKYNKIDDKMSDNDYAEFCRQWFENIAPKAIGIIFSPGPHNEKYYPEPRDKGFWIKRNATAGASCFHLRLTEPLLFYGKFGNKRNTDVFEYSTGFPEEMTAARCAAGVLDKHAPVKSMPLWVELLGMFTNEPILDSFVGNGTTLIACQNLGRRCRAIEISPEYCAVTLERMATAFPGIEIERM